MLNKAVNFLCEILVPTAALVYVLIDMLWEPLYMVGWLALIGIMA